MDDKSTAGKMDDKPIEQVGCCTKDLKESHIEDVDLRTQQILVTEEDVSSDLFCAARANHVHLCDGSDKFIRHRVSESAARSTR